MTRNIRIFLVTEGILAGFGGFILPIYVLYFRYFNITLFQVALLAAVFEASVLLFEIPTGLFADRFGRKLSVNLGFVLFALSGLIFILYRSLSGFIVAEVFFGLAEAFISGAGEALTVDTIDHRNRKDVLQKMYTLRSRIRIAVTSIFMLAAGYLFEQNVTVTFYPVFVGGLIGLIVSLFYIGDRSRRESDGRFHLFAPLKNMIRQVKLSAILKTIFISSLVANFSFEGADQYWQILCSELSGINVTFYGYITAAGAIGAFFLVGPTVRRFSGNISVSLVIMLVIGIIISSMPNVPMNVLPFLIIFFFIGKELVKPLFSIAINRIIDSSGRATFLSGYNLTCSIGEVISGLLVGLIASGLGLPVVFVFCGGILVLFMVVVLFASHFVFNRNTTQ